MTGTAINRAAAAALMLVLGGATASHAQFIGPVPAKGEPLPPSPRPAAPSPPAPQDLSKDDSEPPAPSIVDRDSSGALKILERGAEEEAVARYPFAEDRRAKLLRSIAARDLETDRFVIQKIDAVLKVEAMRERVLAATEFSPLFAARDAVASLRTERLFDRLQRDGAISALQRTRLDQSVREYEKAVRDHFEQQTGGDPTRQAVLNLRQTYIDSTREPLQSLARLLADLQREAANLPTGKDAPLGAESRAALVRAAERPEPERAAAVRAAFDRFSDEEKRAALTFALSHRTAGR